MDLGEYRYQKKEQERIENLIEIIPKTNRTILEIGARDGYLSKKLTDFFYPVVALDLQNPKIEHPGVICIEGNVTKLQFNDNSFDCILCSEVLEHIPPSGLHQACDELIRVAKHHIIVGVPFEQEIRIGRTTCANCEAKNPPYGHVNVFSKKKLENLFNGLRLERFDLIGREHRISTNFLSVLLMDFAGNPFGTYGQEEPCIECNGKILPINPKRPLWRKFSSKMSFILTNFQNAFNPKKFKPIWIHMVFSKT